MAQMRVKDQDLIVEQVINKIEENELGKFKSREDVQAMKNIITERIAMIEKLYNTYKEYEENIKDDVKELTNLVKEFQESNKLEYSMYSVEQGFQLDNVGYGVGVPEYKILWNLPWKTKHDLTTKLRLQTMSGDFDVYKLIEELTEEFSS
jgi:hypothetical protein